MSTTRRKRPPRGVNGVLGSASLGLDDRARKLLTNRRRPGPPAKFPEPADPRARHAMNLRFTADEMDAIGADISLISGSTGIALRPGQYAKIAIMAYARLRRVELSLRKIHQALSVDRDKHSGIFYSDSRASSDTISESAAYELLEKIDAIISPSEAERA